MDKDELFPELSNVSTSPFLGFSKIPYQQLPECIYERHETLVHDHSGTLLGHGVQVKLHTRVEDHSLITSTNSAENSLCKECKVAGAFENNADTAQSSSGQETLTLVTKPLRTVLCEKSSRVTAECDPIINFEGHTGQCTNLKENSLESALDLNSESSQDAVDSSIATNSAFEFSGKLMPTPLTASNIDNSSDITSNPQSPNSSKIKSNRWTPWLNASKFGDRESMESTAYKNCSVELTSMRESLNEDEFQLCSDSQTDKFGFYIKAGVASAAAFKEACQEQNITTLKPSDNLNPKGVFREGTVEKTSAPQSKSAVSLASERLNFDERLSQSLEKLRLLSAHHDAINQQLIVKWDNLMASVERSCFIKIFAEDCYLEYLGFKGSRLQQQGQGVSWPFASAHESKIRSSLYTKLTQLVSSNGIPPKYRNNLWLELSGASHKSIPGEYQRLLKICETSSDARIKSNIEQVDLDLHRTLSLNRFFFDAERCQPGPYFYKLRDILYAFIAHNPEVGYSQGMNRIVGNLLLAVSESSSQGAISLAEEDVFWIFAAIVDDLLPRYRLHSFFDQHSLPSIHNDVSLTIKHHLANLLPELSNHFSRLQVEAEIVVLGWWLGFFTETLHPLEIWFNVIDGLMVEAYPRDKLITYSISILLLCEKPLLMLDSANEVYSFFQKLKNGTPSTIRLVEFASTCALIEKKVKLLNSQEASGNTDSLKQIFKTKISSLRLS